MSKTTSKTTTTTTIWALPIGATVRIGPAWRQRDHAKGGEMYADEWTGQSGTIASDLLTDLNYRVELESGREVFFCITRLEIV